MRDRRFLDSLLKELVRRRGGANPREGCYLDILALYLVVATTIDDFSAEKNVNLAEELMSNIKKNQLCEFLEHKQLFGIQRSPSNYCYNSTSHKRTNFLKFNVLT